MKLSSRMNQIKGSPTSALIARVAELKQQGEDIISLNIGEPDFGTPDNIKIAGIKAIIDNFTKYTPGSGILELRQAIAEKLKKDNGIEYTTNEISTAVGAKQAIFSSLMVLCGEGDEVLLPIPCWVSYTEMVCLAGARPVFVPVKNDEGFALDMDAIKAAITPRTKAIVICTPNNPTGAVYGEESLRQLGRLACEHDFYIVADEIYEKLIYDNEKHFSIAAISEEVRNRTVTVNGMSKAYAMTGWRIGYAAAPKEIIDGIKAIQSQMTSAASAISQKAAVAALNGPQSDLELMVRQFDVRRRYMMERLAKIPGISCATPKGAFYVLPDVSAYFNKSHGGVSISNAVDLATYILNTAKVALVPGENFNLPGTVRMSYSTSLENLDNALTRLEKALALLK